MKRLLITTTLLAALSLPTFADRSEFRLEKDWKFTRNGDTTLYAMPSFNDAAWQTVRVPHDWAVYGPFSIHNDMQDVAITQDGQKEAMEHAGRTGGLPFVGTGWYRRSLDLSDTAPDSRVTLKFDGAMSHARVFVNGHQVGERPYGYSAFNIDITPWVRRDTANTIAVRLENYTEQSRWYPGAGLYRDVTVQINEPAHIPVWGTYITTPDVTEQYANVDVRTKVSLPVDADCGKYTLTTTLFNPQGEKVATNTTNLADLPYSPKGIAQSLRVDHPELWDTEHPALYKAISTLTAPDGHVADTYTTTFGIRTFEIRPDEGAFLNGKPFKFKGVCMHHDLGMLGAATNEAAVRRQVKIMKDMGANAIRTSHNMPSEILVRACDELGMMIMAESFDEWRIPKVKNGYNLHFDQWAERDLTDLIHHFRNNPSVMMWCVGNEVSEQWHPGHCKVALWLQEICHREDPTRPVTQGMDAPDAVINNNFAAVMDVAGFNYRPFKYREDYAKLPQRIVLGTETASTLSSRGVYKFPVERRSMQKYPDHQASSYDVEHCGWSDLPEDNFIYHDDLDYCIGEFVWTGFDYLGEPTPYYSDWPSHSSLFGIVDLAGIPKDRYYLYRSHWNTDDETLHILPHWSWKGREGEVTPVFVYTSYPEAELFINGVSQGRRKKDMSVAIDSSYTESARAEFERQKRYRLMWLDTKYEPGTVKVVAYDENGKPVAEKEMRTPGKPYALKLDADRESLSADGRDMAFINVSVVDRDGNPVPDAEHLVKFKVKGSGSYEASANGNPASLESFQAPQMKLFSGQLTSVVRAAEHPGVIEFEATAPGLRKASLKIDVK